MKRVHVRTGLKQRLNDIIGQDSGTLDPLGTAGTEQTITPWSVQAAMLDNMQRIVKGIVGDSVCGRPMQGLVMSWPGSSVVITPGYGFTKSGNIVSVGGGGLTFTPLAGTSYIYLVHKIAAINGQVYEDGKYTGFIGQAGQQDIVYDDLAASLKDSVSTISSQIVMISTTQVIGNDDLVYLGTVTTPSTVSNNPERGIPALSDTVTLGNLIITGDINVSGDINVTGDTNISGDANVTGDVVSANIQTTIVNAGNIACSGSAEFENALVLNDDGYFRVYNSGVPSVGLTDADVTVAPGSTFRIVIKKGIITTFGIIP